MEPIEDAALNEFLESLSEDDRKIALGIIAEKTYGEIGAEMGISQQAITERIKKMKIRLWKDGEFPCTMVGGA